MKRSKGAAWHFESAALKAAAAQAVDDRRSFADAISGKPKKRSKYGAVKTVGPDGTVFASKAEAKRDAELRLLQRAGKISQLERQVVTVLAPPVHLHGEKRARPPLRYVADFRYFDIEKGHFVVEDTKGRDTPVSRLKRHLMKSVHGIDVVLS